MIAQDTLDAIVTKHLNALWPSYQGTLLSDWTEHNLRTDLVQRVRQDVHEPFKIDIEDDRIFGRMLVTATPVMTETEKKAEAARLLAAEEAWKRSLPPPPLPRLSQAKVVSQDGAFISIEGMIEDLRHWNVPPDLYNEGEHGFDRALHDVIRYLRIRARNVEATAVELES
ncbi:hypothetical protein [uncultured Methylobacterium sp.]|jgi:hypothetical protein|uniref:hypothetical protein n=1 Tax=uncultured Methylobacterium sp. TaxID=157278 RepID=UPI002633991F|nr:hypothetical protein [uncultured Methylobacterium sp.]